MASAPKAAAAAEKDKGPKPVSKSDVVDIIYQQFKDTPDPLAKKDVAKVVDAALQTIVSTVSAGNKVTIMGCVRA